MKSQTAITIYLILSLCIENAIAADSQNQSLSVCKIGKLIENTQEGAAYANIKEQNLREEISSTGQIMFVGAGNFGLNLDERNHNPDGSLKTFKVGLSRAAGYSDHRYLSQNYILEDAFETFELLTYDGKPLQTYNEIHRHLEFGAARDADKEFRPTPKITITMPKNEKCAPIHCMGLKIEFVKSAFNSEFKSILTSSIWSTMNPPSSGNKLEAKPAFFNIPEVAEKVSSVRRQKFELDCTSGQ